MRLPVSEGLVFALALEEIGYEVNFRAARRAGQTRRARHDLAFIADGVIALDVVVGLVACEVDDL